MKRLSLIAGMICVGALTLLINVNAQELSREEYETYALEMFKANKYDKAIVAYSELIGIYPKEASYNYYIGRSYLTSNTDLDKAIKTLKIAASKNYTPDVHYYLAEAYYRNYQFNEAEIALHNFKNLSKKKQQKELQPETLQASIERAREELYMVENVKVISSDEINPSHIDAVFSTHAGGKFLHKPDAFMTETDKLNDYQGIMHQPVNPQNGYEYYISAYSDKGNTGKDIYKVKQLTFMDFSLPETIAPVNSKSNEEYPYFDATTHTLFFSSDRLGGLGGYDIYFSKYDLKANQFTEPKRMGFPINSAYDDFLYVPDSVETALFISNRDNKNGKFTAYKVERPESPEYIKPEQVEAIKQLAQLEVTPPEVAPTIIEPIIPVKEPIIFTEYDLLIQQAMNKQLYCDSLQTVLNGQKNLLQVTEDMNQRRILIAGISETERLRNDSQNEADLLFSEARKLQNPDKSKQVENIVDNVQVEKEIDGLKVYSYLPSEQYAELAQVQEFSPSTTQEYSQNQSFDFSFEIMDTSPYNDKHPIPDSDKLPEGLVYRIQLGAFGKKLPMNTFGGLSPVSAEIIEDRNLTKYYVGYFASSQEARSALEEVKEYGFGDAFVVPYYQKRKITIHDAREIEFGQNLGAK